MFRPVRTLISLAFVAASIWFAFNVPLGVKTLAQHLDAIGETAQARELMDGTRDTVNPVLDEAKQRLLGERVEAPTHIAAPRAQPAPETRRASDGETARLPGQTG